MKEVEGEEKAQFNLYRTPEGDCYCQSTCKILDEGSACQALEDVNEFKFIQVEKEG